MSTLYHRFACYTEYVGSKNAKRNLNNSENLQFVKTTKMWLKSEQFVPTASNPGNRLRSSIGHPPDSDKLFKSSIPHRGDFHSVRVDRMENVSFNPSDFHCFDFWDK